MLKCPKCNSPLTANARPRFWRDGAIYVHACCTETDANGLVVYESRDCVLNQRDDRIAHLESILRECNADLQYWIDQDLLPPGALTLRLKIVGLLKGLSSNEIVNVWCPYCHHYVIRNSREYAPGRHIIKCPSPKCRASFLIDVTPEEGLAAMETVTAIPREIAEKGE